MFPICRHSSKIGFGKKLAFVSVFTVFLSGVRVVGGGDHIYIYMYTHLYISRSTYLFVSMDPYVFTCVYVSIYLFVYRSLDVSFTYIHFYVYVHVCLCVYI